MVQNPVMVIAMAVFKLLIILINIAANRLSGRKVHRRIFNRADSAVWDGHLICRCKAVRINPHKLIHRAAAIMSGQIKIAVIRHICDGVPVANHMVPDFQFVLISQGIDDGNPCIAGIPLIL